MPKLTRQVPSYRRHRRSGLAVVTLNGRDHYLGLHGSPQSQDEYKRLIAQGSAPAQSISDTHLRSPALQ